MSIKEFLVSHFGMNEDHFIHESPEQMAIRLITEASEEGVYTKLTCNSESCYN